MAHASRFITPRSFRFLAELPRNDDRPGFEANEARHLEQVRDPVFYLHLEPGDVFAAPCRRASPRMEFLTGAVGLAWT